MKIHDIGKYKGEFFKILETTPHAQVGVMTIAPRSDSGPENEHPGDQVVYVLEGEAHVVVNGEEGRVGRGSLLIIPAGARHHIYNRGAETLFFLTWYAPPAY
jgi:mannose-6-phosphate isomerase-like protein (cupin superfamily)